MSLPALFVSHGGPDVLISGSPAPEAWRWPASRSVPRAILVMSAHHLAPVRSGLPGAGAPCMILAGFRPNSTACSIRPPRARVWLTRWGLR